MATRAYGCHTRAMRCSVSASARSPPSPSKPVAPIHQVPGVPVAGATCGLAARKAALVRASSRETHTSSHARTSSPAQRDFASAMVMPARTCVRAAAAVTARSRGPSRRAMGCSSQCGAGSVASGGSAPAVGGVRLGAFFSPAPSHTAPIGNLGILTHATRSFTATLHLHTLYGAAFLYRDRQPAWLAASGQEAGRGLPGEPRGEVERGRSSPRLPRALHAQLQRAGHPRALSAGAEQHARLARRAGSRRSRGSARGRGWSRRGRSATRSPASGAGRW